jgi:hypothetical protein
VQETGKKVAKAAKAIKTTRAQKQKCLSLKPITPDQIAIRFMPIQFGKQTKDLFAHATPISEIYEKKSRKIEAATQIKECNAARDRNMCAYPFQLIFSFLNRERIGNRVCVLSSNPSS